MRNNDSERSGGNLFWHSGKVTHKDRCQLLNQKTKTLWFTGLSASGKSTIAYALERRLIDLGKPCYVLDGDNIRQGLNSNLGFSDPDRRENIRRAAEVSKLMNDAGLIVIASFISPNSKDRICAQNIIGRANFFEIYMSAPVDICEKRDPKGVYKKARSGEIKNFTGVSANYDIPTSPFITIDTSKSNISDSVDILILSLFKE